MVDFKLFGKEGGERDVKDGGFFEDFNLFSLFKNKETVLNTKSRSF